MTNTNEDNPSLNKPIVYQGNNLPVRYSSSLIKRGLSLVEEISGLAHPALKARELIRFIGHTSGIRSLTFSPDGQLLASTSDDKTIRLWDIDTKFEYKTLVGHSAAVYCAAFVNNKGQLLSGDWGGDIILWDIEGGKELHRFKGTSKNSWNNSYSYVTGIKIAQDSTYAISVGGDDCIRIWDYFHGTELSSYHGKFESVYETCSFSEDGMRILTAGMDCGLYLWNLDKKKVESTLKIGDHVIDPAIALSCDGKLAIFRCLTQPAIELFDIDRSQTIRHLYFPNQLKTGMPPNIDIDAMTEPYMIDEENVQETIVDISDFEPFINDPTDDEGFQITSLVISQDNRFSIGANSWGEIFMFDLQDGILNWKIKGHKGPVECVSISPDGKYAASGGSDNAIVLWSLSNLSD